MTPAQKSQIQADAERAAQERQTPNEKCPHPFSSEQGRYWCACYWAEWDKLEAKAYHDSVAGAHHEERRGK